MTTRRPKSRCYDLGGGGLQTILNVPRPCDFTIMSSLTLDISWTQMVRVEIGKNAKIDKWDL